MRKLLNTLYVTTPEAYLSKVIIYRSTIIYHFRHADIFQRALVTMFPIFSLRDNRFTKYIVHIPGTLSDYISQLLRYIHINPMAKLPIKERAVWYMDSIHFFYTHDLCCQLHFIHFVSFRFAMLILHSNRLPSPRIVGMQNRIFKR